MEKLWKSYGISFLGICTNPVSGDIGFTKKEKEWAWIAL